MMMMMMMMMINAFNTSQQLYKTMKKMKIIRKEHQKLRLL